MAKVNRIDVITTVRSMDLAAETGRMERSEAEWWLQLSFEEKLAYVATVYREPPRVRFWGRLVRRVGWVLFCVLLGLLIGLGLSMVTGS